MTYEKRKVLNGLKDVTAVFECVISVYLIFILLCELDSTCKVLPPAYLVQYMYK